MKTTFVPIFLVAAACLLNSCEWDKQLSCDAGDFTEVTEDSTLSERPFEMLNTIVQEGNVSFFYTDEGTVRFGIGKSIENICSEEVVSLIYSVITTDMDQPMDFDVIGSVDWSVPNRQYGASLFLTDLEILPGIVYQSGTEISLEDPLGTYSATINVQIFVEFDTLNSFQEDSTYFVDHIKSLLFEVKGDLFL